MTPEQEQPIDLEGHDLGWWLLALVSDEAKRRPRSSKVLSDLHGQSMDDAMRSGSTGIDAHTAFNAAVEAAVSAPGFDTRGYVVALADFLAWSQTTRMELFRQENERVDRLLDRAAAKPGEDSRETAGGLTPRMIRILRAAPGAKSERAQSDLLQESVTAGFVFNALGEHALAATDRLRQMLRSRHEAWHVNYLIRRLGPRAVSLAAGLFERLDAATASDAGSRFQSSQELAAAIAESPALIRAVADRLAPARPMTAAGAASTLHFLGVTARATRHSALTASSRLAQNELSPARITAIWALGPVTQGTEAAVELLLELSRHDDMSIRGAAIAPLGETKAAASQVIPRLIEALDDYQEQDSDALYHSDHERVASALAAYGPAAAPAVKALTSRIRRRAHEGYDGGGSDPDLSVISALGAIGPAARAALPELESLAKEMDCDPDDEDETHRLAVAIRTIRGR